MSHATHVVVPYRSFISLKSCVVLALAASLREHMLSQLASRSDESCSPRIIVLNCTTREWERDGLGITRSSISSVQSEIRILCPIFIPYPDTQFWQLPRPLSVRRLCPSSACSVAVSRCACWRRRCWRRCWRWRWRRGRAPTDRMTIGAPPARTTKSRGDNCKTFGPFLSLSSCAPIFAGRGASTWCLFRLFRMEMPPRGRAVLLVVAPTARESGEQKISRRWVNIPGTRRRRSRTM